MRWRQLRSSDAWWAGLAIIVSCLPVAGALSSSRVFAVRDLAMYFWPKYRWLRHTVFSGQWPWWDPYLGAGQDAAADALNQMFLVPTLLLRLFLPEPLGFNLWVALPFPLAAAGGYLLARLHASRQASSLAAIVFAVSGPVLSTGNFPNMSWSTALVPWVVWAAHHCATRGGVRPVVLLGLGFGAQILAGEPLTMTATACLAMAYVLAEGWSAGGARRSLVVASRTLAGLCVGGALAAVQLMPLLRVSAQSVRSLLVAFSFWSLHPFNLAEVVAPGIFGDYFGSFSHALPWMRALNSGRDPFFFSLYLGVPALCVAACGLGGRRWRGWFWLAVMVLSVIAAFGNYTPIYPLLQTLVPPLRTFRFPPKYLVFAVLALAMLVASGWDALTSSAEAEPGRPRLSVRPVVAVAVLLAAFGYFAALFALVWPNAMVAPLGALADLAGVEQPRLAVSSMLDFAVPHGARLLLLSAGAAWLLYAAVSPGRTGRLARGALFVVIAADLLVTNTWVNAMIPAQVFVQPAWAAIVAQHPEQRFYFGARLGGNIDVDDIDAAKSVGLPPVSTPFESRTHLQARMLVVPSGEGLRETISYDLPMLGSMVYSHVTDRFTHSDRAARLRFLSRTGTRYCVLPDPPAPDRPPLATIPYFEGLSLYDCDPTATRVRVVPPWGRIEPDHNAQVVQLFSKDFDFANMLLLDREPPAASGTPGPGRPAAAQIVKDEATSVDVIADVDSRGGFLLLMDTYDDDWGVRVDGAPAPLLRADGLYRAVRLVPGRHTVSFRFQPRPVLYGAVISGVTLLGCALCLVPWRRRQAATATPSESVAAASAIGDVASTPQVSGPAQV